MTDSKYTPRVYCDYCGREISVTMPDRYCDAECRQHDKDLDALENWAKSGGNAR